MRKSGIIFLFVFGFGCAVLAQEYDDLYFTSSDREKWEKEHKKKLEVALQFENRDSSSLGDDYSAGAVDSKLIKKYDQQSLENRLEYQSSYNSTSQMANSNFSDSSLKFQYSNGLNDEYSEDKGSTIINNYYGYGSQSRRLNSFWGLYGPWSDWSIRTSIGLGASIGLGTSIGFGLGSYHLYDPFYSYYDPWYYNSWSYGYAYSPYPYGGNLRYGYGAYGGCCDGYFSAKEAPSKKQKRGVTRGPRTDRGGAVVSRDNSRSLGNRSPNLSDRRNHSKTQQDYLNRSRKAVGRSRSISSNQPGGSIARSGPKKASSNARNRGRVDVQKQNKDGRHQASRNANRSTNVKSRQGGNRPDASAQPALNANTSANANRKKTNQNRNYGVQRSGNSSNSNRSGNFRSNRKKSSVGSSKPSSSSSRSLKSKSGGRSIRSIRSSSSSKTKGSGNRRRRG